MGQDTIRRQAEEYSAMSEDDLYVLLVPETVRQSMYSRAGLVSRGKTIFARSYRKLSNVICPIYLKGSGRVEKGVDLVVLLVVAFSRDPSLAGIPVFPLSALIAKIGIEEFCRNYHASNKK